MADDGILAHFLEVEGRAKALEQEAAREASRQVQDATAALEARQRTELAALAAELEAGLSEYRDLLKRNREAELAAFAGDLRESRQDFPACAARAAELLRKDDGHDGSDPQKHQNP